jgi:hypothetical protein
MSNAATIMYEGSVESALDLKAATLWLCFAGMTTPWSDDANPPTPAPGETAIAEPLVYIKASVQHLCRPVTLVEWEALAMDARVPVPINGIYYAYVDDEDAYTEVARWLYVQVTINPTGSGHPAGAFRMLRLLKGLVPAAGYEGADWLVPANVSSRGKLRWGDNIPVMTASGSNFFTAHIPIEFR